MKFKRATLVTAFLLCEPGLASNVLAQDAVTTTTVQIESARPVLRMTVDGAPFTIDGQGASWTLADKDPDTDDLSAHLKEGARFCLETTSSAACHIVAKGKVALFVVHSGGKAYYIQFGCEAARCLLAG